MVHVKKFSIVFYSDSQNFTFVNKGVRCLLDRVTILPRQLKLNFHLSFRHLLNSPLRLKGGSDGVLSSTEHFITAWVPGLTSPQALPHKQHL